MIRLMATIISVYGTLALAETRKEIIVIDTGIPASVSKHKALCYGVHYDVTGEGPVDVLGHGTNIIGIISKGLNTSKYCIRSIKWFHTYSSSKSKQSKLISEYVELLKNLPAPVAINISAAGNVFLRDELELFEKLSKKKTYIVVSAGNDGKDLDKKCDIYPACYKLIITSNYFRVVGSSGKPFFRQRHLFSNFGSIVTDYENGAFVCAFGVCQTGTSQATAILTRKLISKEVN